MPEGDTIHHAARLIGGALAGRVPEELLTPHPRLRNSGWPERLSGRAVASVEAYGKHLFVRFEGGLTLHSHLRMTGLWTVCRQGRRWPRSPRRAWLVMRAEGVEAVQFDGPLLELAADARIRRDPRLAALGPDVLGEDFDERDFLKRLRTDEPVRPVGDALLDQRTVAGIGNLWKAEACFAAGIDPWRPTGRVSDAEVLAIVSFARERMRESAERGFSARPRAVYGRAGQPCPRCGGRVRSRGQWEDNRITYWCPRCQR